MLLDKCLHYSGVMDDNCDALCRSSEIEVDYEKVEEATVNEMVDYFQGEQTSGKVVCIC
jgi:hypothetical protein